MSWTNKAVLAWGWVLTPEEIATLSDEVYEEWLDNEWLISSEASDEEFFSGSTHEEFDQFNKRRQEFYKFFSSKQPKFFLILRETDNYYLDSYFMNEIRYAGAHKILGV